MFSNEQLANPTIESSLKDWREQGGLTRLEGSECLNCHKLFYPRRFVCPCCFCRELSTYKFSGKGKIKNIEANSISQVAIIGYRELSPRYLSIIELEEGIDILGEVIECPEIDNINSLIGRQVISVIRKQSRSANTSWKYGYKFKLKEG
ncbi:Zn-ribbon domain-containing OB-fold protein [Streptococcus dentasini]